MNIITSGSIILLLQRHKRLVLLFSAVMLLFLISLWLLKPGQSSSSLQEVAQNITARLNFWEKDIYSFFGNEALIDSLAKGSFTEDELNQLVSKPYNILLYQKSQLIFWSNNKIIPQTPFWFEDYPDGVRYVKLQNAYFQLIIRKYGGNHATLPNITLIGLLPIKYTYNSNNPNLLSSTNPIFQIPENILFSSEEVENGIKIGKQELSSSLYIYYPKSNVSKTVNWWVVALQSAAIILFLLFLQAVAIELRRKRNFFDAFVFFVVALFIVRVLISLLDLPATLEYWSVFDTSAKSETVFLGSLGELCIHLFFVAWAFSFFYHYRPISNQVNHSQSYRLTRFSLAILGALIAGSITAYVLHLIILNFDIALDLSYLITFEATTMVAMLCVVLLFIGFFYFLQLVGLYLESLNIPLKYKLGTVALMLLLYGLSLLFLPFDLEQLPIVVGLIAFVFSYPYFIIPYPPVIVSNKAIFWLVALTVFASTLIYSNSSERELEKRKEFAISKAIQKDMSLETHIDTIATVIFEDTVIQKYYTQKTLFKPDDLKAFIAQNYLQDFGEKYDFKFILAFDNEGNALNFQNSSKYLHDFNKKIGVNSINTSNRHLYLVPNEVNGYNYLSKLPIFETHDSLSLQSPVGYLIIELEPKTGRRESVYPELFSDENLIEPQEWADYSFAIYQNSILESNRGNYTYSLRQPKNLIRYKGDEDTLISENNYSHLIYWAQITDTASIYSKSKTIPVKMVVVSKPQKNPFSLLSLAAYLFISSIILLYLTIGIKALFNINKGRSDFHTLLFSSLQKRINSSIVGMIFLALFFVGAITIYNFYNRSSLTYNEQLMQKINEAQATIDNIVEQTKKLKNSENYLDEMNSETSQLDLTVTKENILYNKVEISQILKDVSKIYDIDINLYDKSGKMISSSLIKIFKSGLLSEMMHPVAWYQLVNKQNNQFVQTEKLGNLNYQSGYIPIKNESGSETVAYLNLPYYARQKVLNREFLSFLITLVNIYFLLLLVGLVVAYFIVKYITNPLKMISDKLKNVKLGQENELIVWTQKDEIGELVAQYNQTIQELEKNVKLLAENERQLAWQEMAKQIAHEIKNCLTPMKLKIQLLQRAAKDNKPNINELSQNTAVTLVEQIDALAQIATEFAVFAKMPKADIQSVNIKEVIVNVADLFHNTENIEIETIFPSNNYFVAADRSQLLRVFNNIVKNAIQAIPENQSGRIEIVVIPGTDQHLTVSIRDNGSGINEEIRDKIFKPNFTTKTSGMGLGMPMTKNIVESFNGKIWFMTELNIGTTFFVELPLVKNTAEIPQIIEWN
jgi:two-component system nitrogen regulation sensor histidine kinase NtrY